MITKKKLPLISENKLMNFGLKVISKKKLGVLIVQNKKGRTIGIVTDGDIKRANNKYKNINDLKVKDVMTKRPITINVDMLAIKALRIMNEKKITSLCVNKKLNNNKTIGLIHIHHILDANIE